MNQAEVFKAEARICSFSSSNKSLEVAGVKFTEEGSMKNQIDKKTEKLPTAWYLLPG